MIRRSSFIGVPTIALFIVLALSSCGKSERIVSPEKRSITQAVYASGKIFPIGFHRIASKVPGIIEQILVSPGQDVIVGQPLIRIRSTASDLAVESAQNVYGLADENAKDDGAVLRSIASELETARAKMIYDSTNAARLRRLLTQQATSQASFDAAQTQYEVSLRQYERAREVYSSSRRRLSAERRTAQINVSVQRTLRDEFVITAAQSGRIYDVLPKLGELVMPQQPLIEIGHVDSIEVELAIDESDISLIALGQSVAFAVDAVKGRLFYGVITSITPRVSGVDKTVNVTASIDSQGAPLLPGMSLEANIVVSRKKDALVLPREVVPADRMLTVRRNGTDVRIRVTTGVEDLRYVEILNGLLPTDEVVL